MNDKQEEYGEQMRCDRAGAMGRKNQRRLCLASNYPRKIKNICGIDTINRAECGETGRRGQKGNYHVRPTPVMTRLDFFRIS